MVGKPHGKNIGVQRPNVETSQTEQGVGKFWGEEVEDCKAAGLPILAASGGRGWPPSILIGPQPSQQPIKAFQQWTKVSREVQIQVSLHWVMRISKNFTTSFPVDHISIEK